MAAFNLITKQMTVHGFKEEFSVYLEVVLLQPIKLPGPMPHALGTYTCLTPSVKSFNTSLLLNCKYEILT